MMKPEKKLVILVYFLLSPLILCLNSRAQSLLWKIDGDSLKSPSYLYGTIHVKDKRVFEFGDSVMAAFKRCEVIAPEVDLSMENIAELAQRMILPDGSTLESLFTPEDYNIMKSVVEETTGMDISLFNKLKPIAVLSLVLNFQIAGDMDVSVDEYLYNKGIEMNKTIIGIETMDEQMEILENIPYSFIIGYFKNIDQAGEDLEQIITLYLSAELGKLLELMQKDESMVMLQDDLVISRNIRMAERISKMIHEKSAFIAVGAGHLPGREGIIRLLTDEGYSVVPVLTDTLKKD